MSRLEIWEHWRPGQPLYVTRGATGRELADDEGGDVWTISPLPEPVIGWENDSGCGGYGLPKNVAEAIVESYDHGVASALIGAKVVP